MSFLLKVTCTIDCSPYCRPLQAEKTVPLLPQLTVTYRQSNNQSSQMWSVFSKSVVQVLLGDISAVSIETIEKSGRPLRHIWHVFQYNEELFSSLPVHFVSELVCTETQNIEIFSFLLYIFRGFSAVSDRFRQFQLKFYDQNNKLWKMNDEKISSAQDNTERELRGHKSVIQLSWKF